MRKGDQEQKTQNSTEFQHPHFMFFGHVPGGIELLEVETHACPRVIGPWIGLAVGNCFWVWVAKSEVETGFDSCGGGALTLPKMWGSVSAATKCSCALTLPKKKRLLVPLR
jgi:hypothetical protein